MTTIFTRTLTSSDSGNAGLSFRNVVPITGASLGQVRATFKAPAAGAKVNHAAIGVSTGSVGNTTATPVELTFAGAHGFTLGANATIVSDWVNLSALSTDKLVVIFDEASTGAGGNEATEADTSTVFFYTASATYNVATPATASGTIAAVYSVTTIETQAVPAGTYIPYNPWPQAAPLLAT